MLFTQWRTFATSMAFSVDSKIPEIATCMALEIALRCWTSRSKSL